MLFSTVPSHFLLINNVIHFSYRYMKRYNKLGIGTSEQKSDQSMSSHKSLLGFIKLLKEILLSKHNQGNA